MTMTNDKKLITEGKTMHLPSASVFVLLSLVAAIAPALPATAQGRIVEASGQISLKRPTWSNFRPVGVGTELRRGDLLLPSQGARVTVLCDNLRQWTVPAGIPSGLNNGCPDGRRVLLGLRAGRSELNSIAGNVDRRIPYIISPRRSWLLSNTPTLRWNPVAGAKSYTVEVRGPGLEWRTQVNTTSVAYPGTPALQPLDTYLLVVRADTGQSSQRERVSSAVADLFYSDDKATGLGFAVLPPEEAGIVRALVQQIEQRRLFPDARAIALADLFVERELYAEAIAQLEEQVGKGSKTATVYSVLGKLYSYTGVTLLAEERYLKGIELARSTQDLESRAISHEGLAQLYTTLRRLDAATSQLKQAQEAYQTLGDQQRVTAIQSSLTKLTSQRRPGQ
jgi:hypothetical protein